MNPFIVTYELNGVGLTECLPARSIPDVLGIIGGLGGNVLMVAAKPTWDKKLKSIAEHNKEA